MAGVPSKKLEGVRKKGKDGLEGAFGSSGAARKIYDERTPHGAADCTAEGGQRSLPDSCRAHRFCEAFDDALADHAGRLGGDVAWRKTCASGGDDQVCCLCPLAQSGRDHVEFVGDDLTGDGGDSRPAEQRGDGGAGEVLSRARETAITDSDHESSGGGREFRGHLFSLRCLERLMAKQHRAGLTIVRR